MTASSPRPQAPPQLVSCWGGGGAGDEASAESL